MDPQVTAAIIAVSGVLLTVIATVVVQISGRRRTGRETQKALEEQHNQLDTTLKEQRKQLDRTLKEQRKQLDRTLAEQRTRTLNERFATAAGQLGSDKPPAVRLAGVYAMAGLADDWKKNRQTCVNVLCAYLRLPYDPDPGDDAAPADRAAYLADREVRHTVIRVITAHLQKGAAVSWRGRDFDFTGVVFDGGDFSGAVFSGGLVRFFDAKFSSGDVNFGTAVFSGGQVSFSGAEFSGGLVSFALAEFFDGHVDFGGAVFSGGTVRFVSVRFSGGMVDFSDAEFSGGEVSFARARFEGSLVSFVNDDVTIFIGAEFGAEKRFTHAVFSGGEVDFSKADGWSHPPTFPWTDTDTPPPPGVKLFQGKAEQA